MPNRRPIFAKIVSRSARAEAFKGPCLFFSFLFFSFVLFSFGHGHGLGLELRLIELMSAVAAVVLRNGLPRAGWGCCRYFCSCPSLYGSGH
jgi:hypothetical protein